MSSVYVRTQIKNFLTANFPLEKLVDLTAQYGEIKEFLDESGVLPDSPWLGIQFLPNDETPITIGADNVKGKYREFGAIYLHVVDVAKLGVGDALLTRGEALRDALRGIRLGAMTVDSVTPLAFDSGATLRFEGGYMSGSFLVAYKNDIDL